MVRDGNGAWDGEGKEDEGDKKIGLYRPPRITAMHFDDGSEAKQQRERAAKARKASKSDIVMALREEFDDTPIEESHHVRSLATDEEMQHRTRFEEDNFLRVSMTKADKKRIRDKLKDSVSLPLSFLPPPLPHPLPPVSSVAHLRLYLRMLPLEVVVAPRHHALIS